jgi:glycosidase
VRARVRKLFTAPPGINFLPSDAHTLKNLLKEFRMINFSDKIFYHIYPIGMCGVPARNDFACPAGNGLRSLDAHIGRLLRLGVNAVYIGPLFESSSHGYDTVDYFHVDRRLGNNAGFAALVRAFHDNGIMVILDAVFNHTGRDFFAFKDVQQFKFASKYTDWYVHLNFSQNNQHNDGFSYEGWAGHTSLVKLNGNSAAVREHLFAAVRFWIEEFNIDGLRLDAANVMQVEFLRELSGRCKAQKPKFWLMGETVAGDYRALAREGCLDSVTNYELYKGLWSSFNDKNFYELSWTLKRQSAHDGLYPHLALYNFVDNHDVNRVSSVLKNPAHLFPLYGVLFCAPGIPSIYYGSEYAIRGERGEYSDSALRPAWNDSWRQEREAQELFRAIADFARVRRESEALKYGGYRELFVGHEQFAFLRESEHERIIVAVNAADGNRDIFIPRQNLQLPPLSWYDMLCPDQKSGNNFNSGDNGFRISVNSSWLRILRSKR